MSKKCFKCGEVKFITDYYKHNQMSDGHLNKCKTCTKKDSKKRSDIITSTHEGLEKERTRHREKYKRLGYRDKQKVWNEKRPHTKSNIYKGLNKKHKIPKGLEIHHWNYSDEFLEDFFVLPIKEHRRAHTFLIKKDVFFEGLKGEDLNSREKHFEYLMLQGIKF